MPEEWVVAQSALRYVGWLKDQPSWDVLIKALTRRPKDEDVTMDGFDAGRCRHPRHEPPRDWLWRPRTACPSGVTARRSSPLLDYIEEPKNNEQSRFEACAALAWVAEKEDFLEIAKKIADYKGNEKPDEVRRACLLEALIQRPVPGDRVRADFADDTASGGRNAAPGGSRESLRAASTRPSRASSSL